MTKTNHSVPISQEAPPPAATQEKRRVLIVDDHPIFRDGISQLINQEPDLMVCGGACSTPQALSAVEELKPDVMVVDISIHGANGIELMKCVRAQHPKLLALMLSSHDENVYAERALRAGARGYVMKSAPPEKVVEALRRVLDGRLYVSEALGSRLLRSSLEGRGSPRTDSPIGNLSDREIEVFRAFGEGKTTREIADALHLSAKTVETHRARIKDKLNIQTAPDLIRRAVEWVNHEANL